MKKTYFFSGVAHDLTTGQVFARTMGYADKKQIKDLPAFIEERKEQITVERTQAGMAIPDRWDFHVTALNRI